MKKLNFIVVVIFAVLFLSCGKKQEPPKPAVNESKEKDVVVLTDNQIKSIGIVIGNVENRVLSGVVNVTGVLDVPPQNLVNITAPFGGFLRSTNLLQGMRIAKGQLLAVIENPEYIQLQQDFIDTRGQTEFLDAEFKRQQELARENVNSQKILQKATADLNSMKAKNDGLRAKLKMLGIDPDKLVSGAIRSTIELRSPINGYVTQVNSSIGSFVNPVDVMFRIVDTEHLHAELTSFERDIPKIKIGQTIRFTLSNETTERTAKVYLIGKEINPDRTVRIHGHIDKEDRDLIPGMYLKATIETGGQALPSLPEEAVLNYEDRSFIFIQENDTHHFRKVEVATGIRDNGFVEVTLPTSVNGNAQIVTKGAYKLLSKMKNGDND